jgi:hypothetical protein
MDQDQDAALPQQPDRAAPARPLPMRRVTSELTAVSLYPVTVLVADPHRVTRAPLSTSLRNGGIGRVLEADSVAEVDAVIADGLTGELALISLEFGAAADRLIHDLGQAGWARRLATTSADDPAPVIRAFRAGAGGVLLAPLPPTTVCYPVRIPPLTDREIGIIRLVAEGRSNSWIGRNSRPHEESHQRSYLRRHIQRTVRTPYKRSDLVAI